MSYFALYKHAPLSEQKVLFPSNFWILVLLSQGGGGGGGSNAVFKVPRM